MESGLGTCLVATRFAERLGLGRDEKRLVFYLSLLQHVGCTAMNHEMAAAIGDEIALRAGSTTLDLFDGQTGGEYVADFLGHRFPGEPAGKTASRIREAEALFKEGHAAACEVAQMLGDRFGLGADLRRDLGSVYERWDGLGHPGGIGGDGLSRALRIVHVVDGARMLFDAGGVESVRRTLPQRAGGWYDPRLVEAFLVDVDDLLQPLAASSRWAEVVAQEPDGPTALSEGQLDDVLLAMAEVQDLKSPYLVGHSTGVARLAERAARRAGMSDADATTVRRAAWLHDLGRVGVSSAIWGKPAALTSAEWEQVRMHAYYTDRVLSRIPRNRDAGTVDAFEIASLHHERNDGSGYFRGAPASILPLTARILAAADAYHAMTEMRPHRGPLDRRQAAAELAFEVRAGTIDAEAARAVLEAAGEPRTRRETHVAGLTAREVEVLGLLARGLTTREIADALTISPKTAEKHVEHIYSKADVSTRSAATLFAIQHDLLADPRPTRPKIR